MTFNAGLLASNDTLYGQGLREDSSTLSGFVARAGQQVQDVRIPFSKMLQPRLGATWAYNGKDTVYASYATLQPGGQLAAARRVVGSQPRDDHHAHFDANGVLFATRRWPPRRASCSSRT